MLTVNGFGFAGRGQNIGIAFIGLKDWSERDGSENSVDAIAARANQEFSKLIDAQIAAFNLPPIIALGNAIGFDIELIDQAGLGHEKLMEARNTLLQMAQQPPDVLMAVRPNGMEDTPQYRVNIDQHKASVLGVSLDDINTTLSTARAGSYVNNFMDRGRVKKVYVMSDAAWRMMPDDLKNWYVRAGNGKMVPFASFADAQWIYDSPRLERYIGLSSLEILGQPAPGRISGEEMALMEQMASQLPKGIGHDWTGMSYQERMSGQQAPALYALSLIIVLLCLAALYESWSIPFAVRW
ncbi:acridine efflux pump [Escherichia coli]|nr:acridine efflux pump [Escherichia coli]